MELNSLRIFCNVVEAGGFSKASSRSRLTQSAISKQIRALEDEMGQKLIERSTHSFELTQAGRLLYERSDRIFHEIDETRGLLQGIGTQVTPRLQIGTTYSVGIAYFPGIFTNFTKANPRCRLDVRVDYSSALIRSVDQRELDCAVVCLPKRLPKSVVCLTKFRDPLAIISSRSFAKKNGIDRTLEKAEAHRLLQEQPVILIGSRNYTRKIIDHYLFEQGLHIEPAVELDSFDLIVSFVSLGLWLSIVPQRVLPVYARSRSVSCQKLANLDVHRDLGVLVHRDRQDLPLIREFVRLFAF